jgi:hypothetical protein
MAHITLVVLQAPISTSAFPNTNQASDRAILSHVVPCSWSEYFDRVTDAIVAERQLKGWSRAKKSALILGDWLICKPTIEAASRQAEALIRHPEERARSASFEG